VVHAALPDDKAIDAQPAIEEVPSWKSMVPVATPDDPETVVVNVTLAPRMEGFSDDARDTAETAFTVCVIGAETAAAYVASPE
jgi:hypothetical protein